MKQLLLGILIVTGAFGLLIVLWSGEKSDVYLSKIASQQIPGSATMPMVEEEEGEQETKNVSIDTKAVQEIQKKDDGTVFVTRVVDGDTIEIENGEKVRYIGVNTPESVDPRRKVQCFGREASAYNKKLVEGKRVRLELDVEDRDKYGRLLRYVWIGDTMINEQLVADGYAQVMTIPPNVKYVERFRIAQTKAREAKQGLWSACHR